jgi:hypothetical protein
MDSILFLMHPFLRGAFEVGFFIVELRCQYSDFVIPSAALGIVWE